VLFLLIFTLLINPLISFSQVLPFDPSNWALPLFQEDFDETKKPEWNILGIDTTEHWGSEKWQNSEKYITYGTEGTRNYLELKAYVENDNGTLKNYSAGLEILDKKSPDLCTNIDNHFDYGYYEIESRLTKGAQSMQNIGLWPAFWFHHGEVIGQPCNQTSKYWTEEVDIFEPSACQIVEGKNYVHYWTLDKDYLPGSDANTWLGEGYVGSKQVDMWSWHTYGLLWLPDRLVFYYDRVPFHICTARVPSHSKPRLFIDLQLMKDPAGNCTNLRTSAGTFIGSFQVNYFNYYALPICNGEISELTGNNYNFSNWSNSLSNVKKYCIFNNTSLTSTSNVIVRFNDSAELKTNFTVPKGAGFELMPKPCN
jgi:beta-glucanase (GH16 family)